MRDGSSIYCFHSLPLTVCFPSPTTLLLGENSADYIYGPGGMLIEEVTRPGGLISSVPFYYRIDQLGSMRAVTSSGSVENSYNFDAYGNTISTTGSTYNPFGYAGEYRDSESSLIYLRVRYYDPATQGFLTRDPLEAWAAGFVFRPSSNLTPRRASATILLPRA